MVVCTALLFVPFYIESRSSQKISARPAFHVLSSNRKIVVKISGDVRYPGIYEVAANSMADTVIKMAEPGSRFVHARAATDVTTPLLHGAAIDLATEVDGTHHITVGMMTVQERMVLGIPLDISKMSEADFDRLPGIGPALARRIVMHRQNNGGIVGVDDLSGVEGIGEKKLEMIRSYVQPAVYNR